MLAASLSVDVEAEDLRLIEVYLRWQDDRVGVVLEEDLRERGAEVRSVDVDLSKFGKIDFFTSRAKDLEARSFKCVGEANGQDFLFVAKCTRAETVCASKILLIDLS